MMGNRPDDDVLRRSDPTPPPRGQSRRPGFRGLVLAAVLGIVGAVLALAGVGAAVATEDRLWDRAAAVGAAVVLTVVAAVLLVAISRVRLSGHTPRHSLEGIQAAIEIEPEVIHMVSLHTHRLGPDELLVAAKVEFLHDLTLVDVAAVVNRIEVNIRANIPEARVVYLEPDVDESHRESGSFVTDTVGHIDRHDPDYARLTGQVPVVVEVAPEDLSAEDLDDEIWS